MISKYTLGSFRSILILIMFISVRTYSQTSLISEDFDSEPASYTSTGVYYLTSGGNLINGAASLKIGKGKLTETPTFNAVGYATITVTFSFKTNGTVAGDTFDVDFWDGTAWVQVKSFDMTSYPLGSVYTLNTITIDGGVVNFNAASKIRFQNNFITGSNLIIDDLEVLGNISTEGPGGVSDNVQVWLRADTGTSTTTNNSAMSSWTDQSGARTNNATSTNLAPPTFRNNTSDNINFNPVLDFDGTNDGLDFGNDYIYSSGTGTQDGMTWFVIVQPDNAASTKDRQFVFDFGNFANKGYGLLYGYTHLGHYASVSDGGDVLYQKTHSRLGQTTLNRLNIDFNNIQQLFIDGNSTVEDSGTNTLSALSASEVNENPDKTVDTYSGPFTIGQQSKSGSISNDNGRYLDGSIAEIIGFNKVLSTTETQKVESYLALKYGITLNPTSNVAGSNYLNSAGATIWDVTLNNGYNYNVAGIGRDDDTSLNQKQSKTINTTNDITMGLETIEVLHSDNLNSFTDNSSYVIWGHNNASTVSTSSVTTNLSSAVSGITSNVSYTYFNRIWKVQQTGGSENIKVSIPASMLPTKSASDTYAMYISPSSVFNTSVQTVTLVQNGSNYEGIFTFTGNQYLTFGFMPETEFTGGRSLYFNGVDNYLKVGDKYDFNLGAFTISAWIKRDVGTDNVGTYHTIISKRDGNGSGWTGYYNGYDLRIDGASQSLGKLRFVWRNNEGDEWDPGQLNSSTVIPTGTWHHVALVYDGSANTLTMYIDGVKDRTKQNYEPPVDTGESFFIGAGGTEGHLTNFFQGNIDELRIWDVALSQAQVQYIMNQEIIEDVNKVNGKIIPQTITKNDVETINWADLIGYYPMNYFRYTSMADKSDYENHATFYNFDGDEVVAQTAPLPYVSEADGSWTSGSTWVNGDVQTIPGTTSIVSGLDQNGDTFINSDDDLSIDWNIVNINHDISMSNDSDLPSANNLERRLSYLSIYPNKELTINGAALTDSTGIGNGLKISHYLKIDGVLDLEGESQLIQTEGSDYESSSIGYLERDQQGTGNTVRYNDWSSPVQQWFDGTDYTVPVNGTYGISGVADTIYNIAGVLRDGSTPSNPQAISFVGGYDGAVGPPIEIANYWLYVRTANAFTNMDVAWNRVGSEGEVPLGAGFLMKGTGSATHQNYVFQGKPNNGDITLTVKDDNDYLVGNPYASAIDADLFIADNSASIKGTIYFWDHFGGNSHILKEYQAGYATYTLMGGVAAVATNLTTHTNPELPLATPTKIPGKYIAVGQAFYVDGVGTGNQDVVFKNSQRVFIKEHGGTSSVFMKPSKNTSSKTTNPEQENEVVGDGRSKFRIGFNAANGGHRQLLLGIDKRASNDVDYGFDGLLNGMNDDDMYWEISNEKFVIQGTNNYTLDSEFPLGLIIKTAGEISIEVDALENIDANTKLYIKDNLTGETYDITSSAFEISLEEGEYSGKFSLVFQPRLKTIDEVALVEGVTVFMNNSISELQIKKIIDSAIKNVEVYNSLGQLMGTWNTISNANRLISIPINLSTGVYFTKVETSDGLITRKIIVR